MKKAFKYLGISVAVILPVWILLMFISVPVQLVSFYAIGHGYLYKEAGITSIQTKNGSKSVHIYKAANKAFLLVGPYRFATDYNDFFFVAKDYVLRTATDKGSDWAVIGAFLLLNDDMSDYWDRLRAPYWFDAVKGDGKIKFNSSNNCYEFKISLDNEGEKTVTFSIPAKCFTADMPEVKAFLNDNKTRPWWITRLLREIPVSNEKSN